MGLSEALKAWSETQSYNDLLMQVPSEWKHDIIDVIDTFSIVKMGLQSIGVDDPFVLIEATKMVIERHDKNRSCAEEP
jgi:hypothetical protein